MRNLRTEDEIIANWKGDIDQPVVSICCAAYNHEPYIEDALEGFLIQETDFPFEILIHDDASTDRTADIIREYETKYPRLVKSIYQVQNQHSQGNRVTTNFLFPKAKGEYIAMCEGDDYWIAPEKLQTQVELMRQHPEINISFHPAYRVDGHELQKHKVFSNHANEVKIFTPEEVILGGGGFMPTASILLRANMLKQIIDFFKKYTNAPVGDFFIQIICSQQKGALYFPIITSTYRTGLSNSWSSSQKKINIKNIVGQARAYENSLSGLRAQIKSEYAIKKAIAKEISFLAAKLIRNKDYPEAKKLIKISDSFFKNSCLVHRINSLLYYNLSVARIIFLSRDFFKKR